MRFVRGLSFKRFLEIAKILQKEVTVITDNDGDHKQKVIEKYRDFSECISIKIVYDTDDTCNTLEPQLVKVNSLDTLNAVFSKTYLAKEEIIQYMLKNKTDWAVKAFETKVPFSIPNYIDNAIQ